MTYEPRSRFHDPGMAKPINTAPASSAPSAMSLFEFSIPPICARKTQISRGVL